MKKYRARAINIFMNSMVQECFARLDAGGCSTEGWIEHGTVCMYICMIITFSRVWINRVRLLILLVIS